MNIFSLSPFSLSLSHLSLFLLPLSPLSLYLSLSPPSPCTLPHLILQHLFVLSAPGFLSVAVTERRPKAARAGNVVSQLSAHSPSSREAKAMEMKQNHGGALLAGVLTWLAKPTLLDSPEPSAQGRHCPKQAGPSPINH